MATWPANAETDWNTKMLAYLAIGHDSDGTHKKSQMLTDMEWSPTAYAGEESITFPNGLIVKQGIESVGSSATDEVVYAVAFPTAFTNAFCTIVSSNTAINEPAMCQPKSGVETTTLQVTNGETTTVSVAWLAIGY